MNHFLASWHAGWMNGWMRMQVSRVTSLDTVQRPELVKVRAHLSLVEGIIHQLERSTSFCFLSTNIINLMLFSYVNNTNFAVNFAFWYNSRRNLTRE